MREIKYRLVYRHRKDLDYQFEIFTLDDLINRDKYYTTELCSGGSINGYDCVDKPQYTGLKDKNGKEIYEGDILAFSKTIYVDRGELVPVNFYEAKEGVNKIRAITHPDIRSYHFLSDDEQAKYISEKIEKIVEGYVIDKNTSLVKRENNGFEPFCDSNANCRHCGGGGDNSKCIVIGNIYENPDLILNQGE